MLEHHFWENFRKWIPHPEVDEVYDVEEIGFKEDGFVVLLRPDHFQEEKRSERALRLVWDRIVSYTVTDESYHPEGNVFHRIASIFTRIWNMITSLFHK